FARWARLPREGDFEGKRAPAQRAAGALLVRAGRAGGPPGVAGRLVGLLRELEAHHGAGSSSWRYSRTVTLSCTARPCRVAPDRAATSWRWPFDSRNIMAPDSARSVTALSRLKRTIVPPGRPAQNWPAVLSHTGTGWSTSRPSRAPSTRQAVPGTAPWWTTMRWRTWSVSIRLAPETNHVRLAEATNTPAPSPSIGSIRSRRFGKPIRPRAGSTMP